MKKILFVVLDIVFVLIFRSVSHGGMLEECKKPFFNKHYKKAMKGCENAVSENYKSGYFYLGKIYLNLNHPKTALEFFKKFKQLSTKSYTIAKAYRYIAISYLNLYLHDKFLYYKDNYISATLNNNYQKNLYMLTNNLVAIHAIKKFFKKTLLNFNNSLALSNKSYRSVVFNDLAHLYFFNRNFNKALFFEKKAIKNAQANRNLKNLPLYLLDLSYFKFVKNSIGSFKNNTWQKNYFNFLINVKKFTSSLSNKHTQISKIIDNAIKVN